MPDRPVVIVSNRGPASFTVSDDGSLELRRGSGGLASGLRNLGDSGATWIAAAITDGDVRAARSGPTEAAGFDLQLLEIPPDRYRNAYDVVANETLWFLHHALWDLPREPGFDDRWWAAWADFRAYNEQFADAVATACEPGAVVLVQDYHLSLLGRMVAERRDDLRLVHFHHTPFCTPDELAVLPSDISAELMAGLAGFDACGFHTARWAADFEACTSAAGTPTRTFVAPLSVDHDTLTADAATEACHHAVADLDERLGDRAFLVRVDRIELSKNLLRGFDAFDLLLEREPAWRERVVFGAFCYPSREGVEAYNRYRDDLEARVAAVNERWSTPTWTPILLESDDDFPRSLGALRRADAVLVNPVRDGLNLVAKEAMVVNERDAALVLSDRAGVHEELAADADVVNPFDVSATATAIDAALRRDPAERARRARGLRAAVQRRTPADWLADQLAAAG